MLERFLKKVSKTLAFVLAVLLVVQSVRADYLLASAGKKNAEQAESVSEETQAEETEVEETEEEAWETEVEETEADEVETEEAEVDEVEEVSEVEETEVEETEIEDAETEETKEAEEAEVEEVVEVWEDAPQSVTLAPPAVADPETGEEDLSSEMGAGIVVIEEPEISFVAAQSTTTPDEIVGSLWNDSDVGNLIRIYNGSPVSIEPKAITESGYEEVVNKVTVKYKNLDGNVELSECPTLAGKYEVTADLEFKGEPENAQKERIKEKFPALKLVITSKPLEIDWAAVFRAKNINDVSGIYTKEYNGEAISFLDITSLDRELCTSGKAPVDGDTVTVSLSIKNGKTEIKNTDEYTVKAEITSARNSGDVDVTDSYELSAGNDTISFRITPKTVNLTWPTSSLPDGITWDGSIYSATYKGSKFDFPVSEVTLPADIPAADNISVVLSYKKDGGPVTELKAAGSYTVEAGLSTSDETNKETILGNYKIVEADLSKTFVITKKALAWGTALSVANLTFNTEDVTPSPVYGSITGFVQEGDFVANNLIYQYYKGNTKPAASDFEANTWNGVYTRAATSNGRYWVRAQYLDTDNYKAVTSEWASFEVGYGTASITQIQQQTKNAECTFYDKSCEFTAQSGYTFCDENGIKKTGDAATKYIYDTKFDAEFPDTTGKVTLYVVGENGDVYSKEYEAQIDSGVLNAIQITESKDIVTMNGGEAKTKKFTVPNDDGSTTDVYLTRNNSLDVYLTLNASVSGLKSITVTDNASTPHTPDVKLADDGGGDIPTNKTKTGEFNVKFIAPVTTTRATYTVTMVNNAGQKEIFSFDVLQDGAQANLVEATIKAGDDTKSVLDGTTLYYKDTVDVVFTLSNYCSVEKEPQISICKNDATPSVPVVLGAKPTTAGYQAVHALDNGKDTFKVTLPKVEGEETEYIVEFSYIDDFDEVMTGTGVDDNGKVTTCTVVVDNKIPTVSIDGFYAYGDDNTFYNLEDKSGHMRKITVSDEEYVIFNSSIYGDPNPTAPKEQQKDVYIKLSITDKYFDKVNIRLKFECTDIDGKPVGAKSKVYKLDDLPDSASCKWDGQSVYVPLYANGFYDMLVNFELSYTDKAGNNSGDIKNGNAKEMFAFDNSEPDVSGGFEYVDKDTSYKNTFSFTGNILPDMYFYDTLDVRFNKAKSLSGIYAYRVYYTTDLEKVGETNETLDQFQKDLKDGKYQLLATVYPYGEDGKSGLKVAPKDIKDENGKKLFEVNVDNLDTEDGYFTLTVSDKMRGSLYYVVEDLATNLNVVDTDGRSYIVDSTKPNLESITYDKPAGLVDADNELVDYSEQTSNFDGLRAYYNGGFTVNFKIKETNFYKGEDGNGDDLFFEDCVKVTWYKNTDQTMPEPLSKAPGKWTSESVPLEWTKTRPADDVYEFAFSAPSTADGYYMFTIEAFDKSKNNMETYTSPILTIDTTAPKVTFDGKFYKADGTAYPDDQKETWLHNNVNYTLFKAIKGTDNKYYPADVYVKLIIQESNFRGFKDDFKGSNIVAHRLKVNETEDNAIDVSLTSAMENYLSVKKNWQQESDTYSILIPLKELKQSDNDLGYFFESIEAMYVDYAGNQNGAGDANKVANLVYDASTPTVQSIKYTAVDYKSIKGVLSKYFWFYDAKPTVEVAATDAVSAVLGFKVWSESDKEIDKVTGLLTDEDKENQFEFTVSFTDANLKGSKVTDYKVTFAKGDGLIEVTDIILNDNHDVTTMKFEVAPEFRGRILVQAIDGSGLISEEFQQVGEDGSVAPNTPYVLVEDTVAPILESITYNTPVQVTTAAGMVSDTVEDAKAYDGYYTYYNGQISVSLKVKESNLYAGLDTEDHEVYFEECVSLKLYESTAQLADAAGKELTDTAVWKALEDPKLTWNRVSADEYVISFSTPVDADGKVKDAHYRYTFAVTDKSGNALVSAGDASVGYSSAIEKGIYTSPIMTIDTTAPEVKFDGYYSDAAGTKSLAENFLAYEKEANTYPYVDQKGNVVSSIYVKLQIVEHNFRINQSTDFSDMVVSALKLDGTDDSAAVKAAMTTYITTESNWKHDGDTHTILLPLQRFGEYRYNVTTGYTDLAKLVTAETDSFRVVYDATRPTVVKIEYGTTSLFKKICSKLFWFYDAKISVKITAEDLTAGVYAFDISTATDKEIGDLTADDPKQITIKIDTEGNLEVAGDGKDLVTIAADSIKQDGHVTTLTFEISQQYRGILTALAYDRTMLDSGRYIQGESGNAVTEGTPVVLVTDDIAPVLEKVVYTDPVRILNPADFTTVSEKPEALEGYYAFYSSGVSVELTVKEANFYAGKEGDAEQYFTDCAVLELYRSDNRLVADTVNVKADALTEANGWKKVDAPAVTWKRLGADEYTLSFNIPKQDGHYVYTITVADKSGNKMVSAGENAVGFTGAVTDGKFVSPILTVDTTEPEITVEYFYGFYDVYNPTEPKYPGDDARVGNRDNLNVNEYYNGTVTGENADGKGVTIKITIDEHNFLPSCVALDMNATDVNGQQEKASAKAAAENLATIVGNLVGSEESNNKDMLNWIKDGDRNVAYISLQSDSYDANYSLKINYTDVVSNGTWKFYYNDPEKENTLSQEINDSFTMDSIAPEINPIENSEDSDVTYRVVNGGGLAKFLNYISFGYFCREQVEVTVKAHDDIAGTSYMDYEVYSTSSTNERTSQDHNWTRLEATLVKDDGADRYIAFRLDPDFKGDVDVYAVDAAGNQSETKSLKGIILESNELHARTGSVNITINSAPSRVVGGADFYNTDVALTMSYSDSYSGLNTVSWDLAASGAGSRSLFSEDGPITYTHAETLSVNADANNRNDVSVSASYQDNVGSGGSTSVSLNIDKTLPVITVTYDNMNPMNETYFKDIRVATVSIVERNLQTEDVVFTVTRDGQAIQPQTSGWTGANGSDDSVHQCYVTFADDGDYTFTVSCIDMAGNQSEYTQVDEFTIDRTLPQVNVAYDNNDAENEIYYNAVRTATVTIDEHNFDQNTVTIAYNPHFDGSAAPDLVPTESPWTTAGDLHTKTINYIDDGEYSFSIAIVDMAGNESEAYEEPMFVIDTEAPTVVIGGVEDRTPYTGTVTPELTFSDVNIDEASMVVSMTFTRADIEDGSETAFTYIETKEDAGVGGVNEIVWTYLNLPEERQNDGLYTLSATVKDLAGNENVIEGSEVKFSVNRFGSYFVIDDLKTIDFLEKMYQQEEMDLKISEYNANAITNPEVTYSVNESVKKMREGSDFLIQSEGSDYVKWYCNTYTLYKENFEEEGKYSVEVKSTDGLGNSKSNRSYSAEDGVEKKANMDFVIDKTSPFYIVTGVDDGEQYSDERRTVTVDARDNSEVDTVTIELFEGRKTRIGSSIRNSGAREYSKEELAEMDYKVQLTIESDNSWQTLKVTVQDMAGNVSDENLIEFQITSNAFYRYIGNRTAVAATAGGVGAVAVGGIGFAIAHGSAAGAAAAAGSAAAGAAGAAAAGTAAAGGAASAGNGLFKLFGKRRRK